MKKEDYKRQLVIANSLYELGLNLQLINKITTVSSLDLDEGSLIVVATLERKGA